MRKLVPILLVSSMLTGCGWFGIGGDDEPEEIQPNPLPDIRQEVQMNVIWSRKIGDGADKRAVKIRPAVSGGRIFGASADGNIKAMTTDTGRVIWEVEVRDFFTEEELREGFTKKMDTITGGVGAGGDLVTVGTASGELIALNQSDGSLAWRTRVSSEILSAPQVDRDLVVAQTIDGKVAGYDALDGTRTWIYQTNNPALTLRGTATPIIVGQLIIAGFANGRVAFLDRNSGLAGFDQRIAIAQGDSDLERLVDIDGNMQVDDGRLYVASFQGRLVAIEIASGRMLWAEEASTVEGVGTGFGNVYMATADSQLRAFDAGSGREIWNIDALLHREITAPTSVASFLAFADFEGYVHVVAQSDGRFVGRRRVDGQGLKAGLISAGGRLYAMGDSGTLSAIEIR